MRSSLQAHSSWLLHVAGLLAVSQLLFGGLYNREFFEGLSGNTTIALAETFEKISSALSWFLPRFLPTSELIPSTGTLLQTSACVIAALYALFLAR